MSEDYLKKTVVNELRKGNGDPLSGDLLYDRCGGLKSTGLTMDAFRVFVEQHCSRSVKMVQEQGNENILPMYTLQTAISRKQSTIKKKNRSVSQSSSRAGTPDGTLRKFSPKKDGFRTFYHIVQRMAGSSRGDSINWNDIRSNYRKETGRHLNTEELNAMCGTENLTKHDLLTQYLYTIVELVDGKGQIVCPVALSPHKGMNTPSPIAKSLSGSPSLVGQLSPTTQVDCTGDVSVSAAAKQDIEELKQKRREFIVEQLRQKGVVLSADGRPLSSEDSDRSGNYPSNFKMLDDKFNEQMGCHSTDIDEVFTYDSEIKKLINDSDKAWIDDITASTCNERAQLFEEEARRHENSMPDEDPQPVAKLSTSEENQWEREVIDITGRDKTPIAIETGSTSVNLVASPDSEFASFVSAGTSSHIFETSGEQGYTTGSEQAAESDMSIDISFSMNENTPRETHEITLCSSRIDGSDITVQDTLLLNMSPLKVNVIANEREVTNFEETHGVSCVNKSDKNLLDLPALVEVDELTDVFPSCIPSSEEVISSVDIQQNVAIGTATVILDCISEDDISASVQDSGETERIVTVIERIKKLPEDSTDTYETDSDIPYDDNLLLDDEVDLIPRKRSDAKVKSESLPELFQQRQPRTQIVIVDVEPEMKPKLSESDTWEKEFVVECKSTRGSEGGESGTVVAVREFLREVEDSERNVDNAMVFEPKNTIESLEIPVVELSPNMELIERAIIFDKIEANSEREVEVELEQKANKKKKRVQVIVPRKRIFNCCTLL